MQHRRVSRNGTADDHLVNKEQPHGPGDARPGGVSMKGGLARKTND